jgi:hypothetical protein
MTDGFLYIESVYRKLSGMGYRKHIIMQHIGCSDPPTLLRERKGLHDENHVSRSACQGGILGVLTPKILTCPRTNILLLILPVAGWLMRALMRDRPAGVYMLGAPQSGTLP